MKVLVTGGAGFIGAYVSKHLVEQGHEVIIADRFDYPSKGRGLQPILKDVKLLIGDLATGDLARRCAAEAPEWVVHMAANTHVDRAIADPESFMWSNVLGTTRLLQAFWDARLLYGHAAVWPDKMIVYSTDEVYGPTPPAVTFGEDAPFKPSNAYSASKVGVEGVAHAFYVTHTMPIVVARPCNTYAPGQHPEKVVPRFVGQLMRGEPLTVYNDGRGSRDWMHATDHARAIETLLQAGVPGQAYNLAAYEEHSDLDIATRIAEICLGRAYGLAPATLPIVYQPGRPGHDKRYAMDGTKLRALGWKPCVSFDEGFEQTVRWTMAHTDYWDHDLVEVG